MFDPRVLWILLAGLGLWGAVVLERPLRRLPISLPMVYVGLGWAAFSLGLPPLDPAGTPTHTLAAEYLTEFIVIVSLMGAGIAIDRPFSWRAWEQVWPLLLVTMPLSIVAVAVLGWGWLGLTPAAALLLAAALSPTDPVLARSVQVGPPGQDERHDVRFNLTVEAGFNDGLAFPFTYLAIAAAGASGLGAWIAEWALLDVVWRVGAGVAVGYAVGWAGAWSVFNLPGASEIDASEGEASETHRRNDTNEGLVVMGTLLAAYGLAEVVGGYGFLAVFVGAVTARQFRSGSEYHVISHHFVDQVERVVLVGMLLGFGGLLAGGVLAPLTLEAALLGLAVVFILRPLAGIAAQLRCALPWSGRLATAFLGIRGMGTIYYLAYGQTHAAFDGVELLWATASFAILTSIVVHGVTAVPLLRWVEARGGHVVPEPARAPDARPAVASGNSAA